MFILGIRLYTVFPEKKISHRFSDIIPENHVKISQKIMFEPYTINYSLLLNWKSSTSTKSKLQIVLKGIRGDRRRFTSAGGVLKTMLFLRKTILEVYQHNQECLLWGLRWTDTYPPMCHQFNITAAHVSANRLLMARGTRKTTANLLKKKTVMKRAIFPRYG